ncbi:hypothetical protein GOP47_0029379, partial [Adiantum capillus-veneris]
LPVMPVRIQYIAHTANDDMSACECEGDHGAIEVVHHSCSCVATALPQQIRRGPGGCLPSYRVYRWCQLLHGLQNPVSIMPSFVFAFLSRNCSACCSTASWRRSGYHI